MSVSHVGCALGWRRIVSSVDRGTSPAAGCWGEVVAVRRVVSASLSAAVASGVMGVMLLAGCRRGAESAASEPTADTLCDRGLAACRSGNWQTAMTQLGRAIDSGQLNADRYVDACCA